MAEHESHWSVWVRNGRLATIIWGVTFVAWLSFKIADIPLESLDTVFVIMSGMWTANLGITTVKPSTSRQNQRDADKAGDTNA